MASKHKKVQKRLVDLYYSKYDYGKEDQKEKDQYIKDKNKMGQLALGKGNSRLAEDLRTHLESCKQCRNFWTSLKTSSDQLDLLDQAYQLADHIADGREIGRAISRAEGIRAKRKEKTDLAIFILLACLFVGAGALVIGLGLGSYLLKGQLVISLIGPLFLPLFIRRRLKREADQ